MDTWVLLAEERRGLAATLEALPPDAWSHQSQCEDWTVRDVAAHVAMTPELRLPGVLPAMIRHRFNIPRLLSALAREDRRSPAELVRSLRAVAEDRHTPPKASGENVLADIVLHGQDIRRPLGLSCGSSEPALRAAAALLTRSDFNCGSAQRVKALSLVATDVDWSFGEGSEVRGPLHAILEGIGGRADALGDLAGAGVRTLRERCPRRRDPAAAVA